MNKEGQQFYILLLALCLSWHTLAQKDTSKWKALFAAGVNSPSASGFVEGFEAKGLNFPTINLGVQHMFTPQYGVKLDYGFNRLKIDEVSPEIKVNYSRVNAQFVYDITRMLGFLPHRLRINLHAGPGFSFVRPLNGLDENNQNYFNFLGGMEFHYGISERLSVFTDLSYILGLTNLEDYNPATNGLGAFNGNLLNITIGLAVSLSDCQYCN